MYKKCIANKTCPNLIMKMNVYCQMVKNKSRVAYNHHIFKFKSTRYDYKAVKWIVGQ